jgi:hypothetical protein
LMVSRKAGTIGSLRTESFPLLQHDNQP